MMEMETKLTADLLRADRLQQAILKKAFTGELLPRLRKR
jgi:hypothetical protein